MYSMRPTTTLTECGLMCTRVSTTRHLSVHLLGLTTLTNCVFLTQLLTSTSWTQRLISHRTQQQTTRKENSMSFETHDTSAEVEWPACPECGSEDKVQWADNHFACNS